MPASSLGDLSDLAGLLECGLDGWPDFAGGCALGLPDARPARLLRPLAVPSAPHRRRRTTALAWLLIPLLATRSDPGPIESLRWPLSSDRVPPLASYA